MTELLENVHLALPEMIILTTACVALLCDLFLKQRFRGISFIIATIGILLAASVSFLFLGNFPAIILNGLFISDDIGNLMKLFIYIAVFLGFFYSRDYIAARQLPMGDYYVLGLLSMLGMMALVSAHSLLTIYLGLELLSLPMYAMTAITRSNADATEAAMKYFVMGAIASGMLLYGISLLYGATGQLDLLQIANKIAVSYQEQGALISFALVFIIAGVGFKVAAMPFHMWVPDVYQGSPNPVTLFIATAPKIAALGMALRILMLGLSDIAPQWQQLLLIMTLLSTGLGNLFAIAQTSFKRLLGYSAISHMGYALFGLLAGTGSGYAAALYYVLAYALMSTAAFGLIVMMSRLGVEIDGIDDLKGLNKRNPWLAFLMLIVLLSMAGIPPTVGFFAKLLVLKALVDASMTWVAVLGLVFAVIGAFYYLKVIKVMYFDEPVEVLPVKLTRSANVIFSINCLILLYWGIFPSVLIAACYTAVTP